MEAIEEEAIEETLLDGMSSVITDDMRIPVVDRFFGRVVGGALVLFQLVQRARLERIERATAQRHAEP